MTGDEMLTAHMAWIANVSLQIDHDAIERVILAHCFHEHLMAGLAREGAAEIGDLRKVFASNMPMDMIIPILQRYSARRTAEVGAERNWGVHAPGWNRPGGLDSAVEQMAKAVRLIDHLDARSRLMMVARTAVQIAVEVGGDWLAELKWQRNSIEARLKP